MIEEIKSRLSMDNLLARLNIQANRAGFIHSIYREEKTPSLKVYFDTNSFYCFATNTGGDILKFYSDYCKIDTKKAITELAEICGITRTGQVITKPEPEKRTVSPGPGDHGDQFKFSDYEKELFEERAGIIEFSGGMERKPAELRALEEIKSRRTDIRENVYTALFHYCNKQGLEKQAERYLTSNLRKLKPETIERFKLFTIHSPKSTLEYLRSEFSSSELDLSGLISQKGFFVFSYHRIIIPYLENGRIVYLRGRYFHNGSEMPGNGFSKYIGLINSYGGLTAKRLYNIDLIKSLPGRSDLFLTEGEFDSMIMNQSGLSSVGVPGTGNFPKDKIQLLSNYNIYLCFDNDEAGEKAVKDVSSLFSKPVKQVKLKNVKDITEAIE